MKKSLIALAALATVGAAQAQSSVSISGLIDMGIVQTDAELKRLSTNAVTQNGSATSGLIFSGREDLGGGSAAFFQLRTDIIPSAGATNNGGSASTGVWGNSENFVGISSKFGTIRAGNINNVALSASSASQPFATNIGSGYSSSFGRLSGIAVNGTMTTLAEGVIDADTAATPVVGASGTGDATANAGGRIVRTQSTLSYTTPELVKGLRVTANYSPKNSRAGALTTANTAGAFEIGAAYSAGALNIVAAQYELSNPAVTPGTTYASMELNEKQKHTLVGANYKIGKTTVYAGYTTSKSSEAGAATRIDARSQNVALKYDLAANISVMANYISVKDKVGTDEGRDLLGLGADYLLSKRTALYARFEKADNQKNGAAAYNDVKRTAVGVRHSF